MRASCGVYYYIFPTYSQAKKVIWDSITNNGKRMLEYFPKDLVVQSNSQEMKIRMKSKDGGVSLFQLIGSDNFDCFDNKTEVLTNEGWKLFKDLNRKEKVASLNPKTLEFEWELPLKWVEYDFYGNLLCIKNSSLDFAVTPNHRLFVKSAKGRYKFKEIGESSIRHDMVPSTCRYKGKSVDKILGYDSHVFMKFLGIFLSEGSTFKNKKCYRIHLSQKKEEVRLKIKLILRDMGVNFCENRQGFNIENKRLYEYCSQFGKCNEKFIPRDILSLSKYHLHDLFEYLVMGDGHKCNTYTAFYSTSKGL